MDLRQINQFLAVAETLSFRKAAERLHMAQPPLSMAIRRIEVAIGAPLFKRGRRGVTLTEVGAAILADARRVAFQAEQLRRWNSRRAPRRRRCAIWKPARSTWGWCVIRYSSLARQRSKWSRKTC